MSYHDPTPGHHQPAYDQAPPEPRPYEQPRPYRNPDTGRRTGLIIHTIADVAAAFLGLWILLYLFDANQANVFVEFVHGMADWLAWWSQDIFTMDTEGLRVVLNYGLPALIYLAVGHGISVRLSRA
ncbi:hypothetical protein [Streptomyces sp. NPDC046805]|uniref:hypothetical protein n=1 Tax=Streptomyces sp. NPDC046805 TaxID=3155134 RepID=UPI0033FC98F8